MERRISFAEKYKISKLDYATVDDSFEGTKIEVEIKVRW